MQKEQEQQGTSEKINNGTDRNTAAMKHKASTVVEPTWRQDFLTVFPARKPKGNDDERIQHAFATKDTKMIFEALQSLPMPLTATNITHIIKGFIGMKLPQFAAKILQAHALQVEYEQLQYLRDITISALLKEGQPNACIACHRSFAHLQDTKFSQAALISAFGRKGDLRTAKRIHLDSQYKDNLQIQNAILSAYANAPRIPPRAYWSMLAKFKEPDLTTYNTLFTAFLRKKRLKDAARMFQKIRALSPPPLNDYTKSALIKFLIMSDRHAEAVKLCGRWAEDRTNSKFAVTKWLEPRISYTLIRNICTYVNRYEARKAINYLKIGRIVNTLPLYHAFIKSLIFQYPHTVRIRTKLFDLLKECDPTDETHTLVVTSLAKTLNINAAGRYYKKHPTWEALPALLLAYLKRNRVGHALKIFQQLIDYYEKALGKPVSLIPDENMHACLILLHGLTPGDSFDVLDMLETMEMSGLPTCTRVLNAIMYLHCQKGDISHAEDVFASIPRHGLKADVESYQIMLQGYIARQDLAGMWRIWRMINRRLRPVPLRCWESMIRALTPVDSDAAIALVKAMRSKCGLRPSVHFRSFLRQSLGWDYFGRLPVGEIT